QAFQTSVHLFNSTLTSATRTVQRNFATAGAKAGSRSFTVTGEGLAGETVNPLSVSYTATALDHSNASFTTPAVNKGQTIDFGYVPAGFAPRMASFSVSNLASASGATLTAGLNIDGVVRSGSAQMSTDVAATNPATPLAAGASAINYTATFTPDPLAGDNSATHSIAVSDENIPGATSGTSLVLTTTGRTVTTGTFPVTGFINLLSGETYTTGPFQVQGGVTLTKTGPGTMNV